MKMKRKRGQRFATNLRELVQELLEEEEHLMALEEEHSNISDDGYTVLGSVASSNDNRRELKSQVKGPAEENMVHFNDDSARLRVACVCQQEQLETLEYHPLRLHLPRLPSTNSAFTPFELKRRQMNSPMTRANEPTSRLHAEQFDVR
ncbi:unnamed protein product [Dicrocoelium dendriticum]|nr:unnamed protein product [Dicrocoelium dendriticum]